MFFNTVYARGQKLTEYEIHATKQETAVYEFFRRNPKAQITPEDILKNHPYFGKTPITSVRRAFTNLAKEGRITKTDNQVIGMYGMPIHTWVFGGSND